MGDPQTKFPEPAQYGHAHSERRNTAGDSLGGARRSIPTDVAKAPSVRLEPRASRTHAVACIQIASVVGALFISQTGSAQAQECAPEITENRRAQIEHNGDAGIWFALPVARCLLRDVGDLTVARSDVRLLRERLTIRDDQITSMRAAHERTLQIEQRSDEAIDLATTAAREATADANHERSLRWVWFGIGVAVVVVIEVVAILIFSEVTP